MLPAPAALEVTSDPAMCGLIVRLDPTHPECMCAPLQAAVEYFRLMLPPWDAKGLCNEWEKMAVRLLGAPNNQCTAMHLLRSRVCIACQTLGLRLERIFIPELQFCPCTPHWIDFDWNCLGVG